MRFEVVKRFSSWFASEIDIINSVAVVGGTSRDLEVTTLKQLKPHIGIDFYGIDNPHNDVGFAFLDLNNASAVTSKKYDLVLCSQVLEHVHNMEATFNLLANLTKEEKFLWINCPASNIVHGSPNFYSAGYAPEFIVENMLKRNFRLIIKESIGSKRYYFMTHMLRFWATEHEHHHPILGYNFQPGSFLGVTRKFILDLPGRFQSLFYSKKITNEVSFSTESIVLVQAKESLHP